MWFVGDPSQLLMKQNWEKDSLDTLLNRTAYCDAGECLTSPCDPYAVCSSNNDGSFDCTCNAGFNGDGLSCTDDDECLAIPCDLNALCSNNPGSFSCACNAGFSGDGFNCIDNDECLTIPCDPNAICSNNPGSFDCSCNAGFSGDGLSCADVDECLTIGCDLNATCSNIPGSFNCTCNTGFSGDGFNCSVCSDYLGMESGEIGDADITASAAIAGTPSKDARLNAVGAWEADDSTVEWIQADIGYQTYVSGVITQGDGGAAGSRNNWVTSFKVSTFLSTINDTEVFVRNQDGTEMIFPGNFDIRTEVKAYFPALVYARIVRIVCLTAFGTEYGFRFDILGCSSGCSDHLGMESGEIKDGAITASATATGYLAANARLNGKNAWEADGSTIEWIQVDLGYQTYVLGLITQGDGGDGPHNNWVTSFKVSTFLSTINDTEVFVVNQVGDEIIYPGNPNIHTKVTALFLRQFMPVLYASPV
ncbi:lactadherin-like [Amphiura filiformis]|uniref:lactadherin-like n=1 Tax=Amphiura filiformis TaxID=82378 RepID=UPI003B21E111